MSETENAAAAVATAIAKQMVPSSGRGGKRPGAGRKPGSMNRLTKENVELAKMGKSPVQFLLEVMSDPERSWKDRIDAAKAVCPYVAPRLAAIENTITVAKSHEEMLNELE